MTTRGWIRGVARVILASAAVSACSSGTTQVVLPELEALIAGGDGQYGTKGQLLGIPLDVVIRTVDTGLPRRDVVVVWSVEEGDAVFTGLVATVTDSAGTATQTVRLGQTVGPVRVRAAVDGQEDRAFVDFSLFVVDRPALDAVSPVAADPGASVTLSGRNFSPVPDQNVVLFSGIRARVTAASSTQLTVTVPSCMPERPVAVTVQLGTVGSGPKSFTVGPGGSVRSMVVGEAVDATDPEGFTCLALPGGASTSYLVLVQSSAPVGTARHPYRLAGLAGGGPLLAPARDQPWPSAAAAGEVESPSPGVGGAWQLLWDEELRRVEGEMIRARSVADEASGPPRVAAPSAVPVLNERRTFQVYRGPGDFAAVTAVARYVGEKAAFFVDEEAPAGGYTEADLQEFSDRFDDVIHPTVETTYGVESDLDDNDRVVILFSPVVNSLTPRGASGFIGGFFFGIDLLPESQGSNAGEIFYSLVPDPNGVYSDPRPKDALMDLIPAVLAHEFQHMVNFNERVLKLGAQANEAVWLSEGLAQYAEELVARAYEDLGDANSAESFRGGVRDRTRRYLADPGSVSLLVPAGSGSLAERGAGFLFVMYVADRFGPGVVATLTRTTRTGVGNVEISTGTPWAPLLSDWWSASYLDGAGASFSPWSYPSVDLRDFLGTPYPLTPDDPGEGDFTRTGSLPSSSAAYYQLTPASTGTMTVRLGGDAGAASAPQAGIRMRIIRIQ